MTESHSDPYAQAGKWRRPVEHVHILVVGAGPAGCAAAVEAAEGGASVMLVDENPVSAGLIGMDVPLYYGGRAGPAVHNKQRMVEQICRDDPALEAAFEAGVDVRLGTCCWGVFRNRPGLQTLPATVAGLSDEEKAWLVSFDRAILATGARDLVLSFQGADQPGVMGALGFDALARRYEAFEGRSVLILGTGDLALGVAELALHKGLSVVGMVEVRSAAQGDPGRVATLRERGIPFLTDHVIREAKRGATGLSGASLASLRQGSPGLEIACDTIVLAVDRVPVVDLADVAGLPLRYDAARGGHVHVPSPPSGGRSDAAPVLVAGDCAGLVSPEAAQAQGRGAASAALAALRGSTDQPTADLTVASQDRHDYRMDWMRALLATGSPDVPVCLCEEVSRAELLGVRPPRYLGPARPAVDARNLVSLSADGPIHHDQVKRLTRACMGPCQGRRCREQVGMVLAIGSGGGVGDVTPGRYRPPVRPLPLAVLADAEEHASMRAGWDAWFGIKTQWVPYDDIGTEREAAFLGATMHL